MLKRFTVALLALLLVLTSVFGMSTTVAASPTHKETSFLSTEVSTASSAFIDEVGQFSTFKLINFTVPSSTDASIIFSLKYVNSYDSITIYIFHNVTGKTIVSESFNVGSTKSWSKTLPAGEYTVHLTGGSNASYVYGLMVSPR